MPFYSQYTQIIFHPMGHKLASQLYWVLYVLDGRLLVVSVYIAHNCHCWFILFGQWHTIVRCHMYLITKTGHTVKWCSTTNHNNTTTWATFHFTGLTMCTITKQSSDNVSSYVPLLWQCIKLRNIFLTIHRVMAVHKDNKIYIDKYKGFNPICMNTLKHCLFLPACLDN